MPPRRCESLFALIAAVPLAINPALLVTREAVSIGLCSGDGRTGAIALPVGPVQLPGEDQNHCCGKACHAGSSRKRLSPVFDPAQ
jgi:hypothetical protein